MKSTKILFLIFFIFLFGICTSYSQYTPTTIVTDTTLTNIQYAKSFYVKNTSSAILKISNIKTLSPKFYFTITSLNINPNDSALVTVYFKTNQNITYNNFLIFENSTYKYPLIYYIRGTAKYPDTLYRFTQGLIDEDLKTALRTFTTTGYITLGYNVARDKMYETVDDYDNNDTLECIYTGRRAYVHDRAGALLVGFNCEHTWPQSFFNSNDPMVSDIFHLYPTDDAANNVRSNYPFGIVVSDITWSVGGSKLGKDFQGAIAFEPRDAHKGNCARSMFYFAVKYTNLGGFMTANQENAFRIWNDLDTVDAKERIRNNRIKTFVNVRNPFIDHPEFIERIKSTYTTIPNISRPKISASPLNVRFDTLSANDTSSYYLAVMNYGTGNLTISNVSSSLPQFTVESFPAIVPQNELRFIKIKFKPTATNQTYSGILTITNIDSTINVNLAGFSNNSTGIINLTGEIPTQYSLSQNYPNPFNPTTKIKFSIPVETAPLRGGQYLASLKIFDINGREVSTLVSESLQPGTYEVEWNAANFPSGIYFYSLKSGIFSETRRMILLK
jgi:hypothetical protein